MGVAVKTKSRWSSATLIGLAIGLAVAAPAAAQAPAMLNAPGLSPVPSDAPSAPAVAALPQMSSPQSSVASSCDVEMVQFQKKRNAAVEQINQIAKKGKKLDPGVACPRFRNLVAVETQMKGWMLKNKDWCSIPDEVIENMRAGFARTPVIANQACNAAAQVSRMKRQAQQAPATAAQPAIKLPSGPL